jgi:hypothetical protein
MVPQWPCNPKPKCSTNCFWIRLFILSNWWRLTPMVFLFLILHGHGFHITLEVVEEAKNVGLDLLTLPIHIYCKFHPLDVNVLKPFKIAFHKFWYIKSLTNKHKCT